MLLKLGWRMLTSTEPRLLWKFLHNFCWGGMRSIQKFKKQFSNKICFKLLKNC